jgi:hypothetical protein
MILELDQNELELVRLAISCAKLDLRKEEPELPTPGYDAIASKVNAALKDIQKDIQFEKYREL